MNISKEVKRLEKSNISMTITVPKDEIRAKYREILKETAKNVQIPGFRKGHVPQEVLERKFADALKQDALGRIMESALHEIFEDKDLPKNERPLPYSTPEIQEEPKFDIEQDFKFTVVYDVLPEVKPDACTGLKVEYPYAEVNKEDIARELEVIRERNAIVMDCDDNVPAKDGNIVTIDYQIFEEDGSVPDDMQRKDFTYTLGPGNFAYKFDDKIIGMKKGETKECQHKFESDYISTALAGKTRKIKITLNNLKEKKLPDLDDDFAQDVDEKYKTLDDLKNSIKEKLEKNLEKRLRDVKTSKLLEKIMENTPVTLPESMIKAHIESKFRNYARYYNTTPEAMMEMMAGGEDGKKRMQEWRAVAEKELHSRVIIETLIERQNFEITDEDTEKELENIAAENDTDIAEVKKHYNDEQAILYLKEEIKERRIIDILLAENTFKQGKKEIFLDFMNQNS